MKNKGRSLRKCVTTFANDLRQLAQLLNDGVSFLSKTIKHKPCIGPTEFQEMLSNMQEEVTDLTTNVETLDRLTFDCVSFEELLGHCVALYQSNRTTIEYLETHLQQYGYRQPPGMVVEPEKPLSAARIAAAAARINDEGCMQGADGTRSWEESEEEEEEEEGYTGIEKVPPNRSFEMLTMVQPALASTASVSFQNKTRRRYTPVDMAQRVSPCSSRSEREDVGNGCAKNPSVMERDTGVPKRFLLDIHQSTYLPPGADAMAVVGTVAGRVHPIEAMTGKSHILMSAHTASLSAAAAAAASVHASARKTPRSRATIAANRDASPERLYSPYTAKLLAKLNPPEAPKEDEGERCPISLAVSFDMACLPDINTTDLSTAMRDFAPFERSSREANGLGGVPPTVQIGSQVESKHGQPGASIGAPLAPAPVDDMDTCTLYQELIRKPALTTLSQPQQAKPFVPPLNLGQVITCAPPLAEPARSQRQPLQQSQPVSHGATFSSRLPPPLSPGPPLPPPAGSTPERERPAAVVASGGSSRCATPLSALRAHREQHNKLLAEKMAGLEREWIESGQAALTPMRRSLGGGPPNGDAQPYVRSKSPGPSRALAEAAAAAAAALLAPPVAAWGPERSLQQGDSVADLRPQGHMDAESRPRVLSPLQPSAQTATSNAAANTNTYLTTQHRTSRGSSLPVPPAQPVSTATSPAAAAAGAAAAAALTHTVVAAVGAASNTTTVVGATMSSRRDVSAGDASLRSSVSSKPVVSAAARTPTRPGRGIRTPLRLHHASNNSPVGAIGAMGMNPSRRIEGGTPRGAMRTAAGMTTTTGAADVRASKVTPHRKSYATAPLEAAAVAAAAATVAIEPLSATPGRARRLASAAMMVDATASVIIPRPSTSNVPSCILADSAIATATTAATAAPSVVPQLRLDDCRRPESGKGAGGVWTGFPCSQRGVEVDSRLGAHPVLARRGLDSNDSGSSPDEVTLGMPPAVSNPNTPTPATPGGRSSTGGIPASGVVSPNVARLASHPLGDIFGVSSRPSSRIPTPGKSVARHSRLPSGASASASDVTVASSTASFTSLEPCHEEEWRGLPGSLQSAFPIDVLNGHIQALAQVLASRRGGSDASTGGTCFSAADLEPLSMNSATAKRLLYTLVKLGRCQVVGGGPMGAGSMLYRLSN